MAEELFSNEDGSQTDPRTVSGGRLVRNKMVE